jgi:DNA-binding GntR family transcriptional regulator
MNDTQNLPLSEVAYNHIRKDILSCAFEPGSQVSISFLSNKYKLGKSPINSALQKLMNEGLIQSRHRVGYTISHITIRDVNELFEMRLILEEYSAELTAKYGSEEDIKHILDISEFTYVHKDKNSYALFLEKNMEFHRQIILSTRNSRLLDTMTRLLEDLNRIFYLGLDIRDSAEEMRVEHHNLAIALSERDADKAKKLAGEQIIHSRNRIMEALSKQGLNQGNISLQDIISGDHDRFDGLSPILNKLGS